MCMHTLYSPCFFFVKSFVSQLASKDHHDLHNAHHNVSQSVWLQRATPAIRAAPMHIGKAQLAYLPITALAVQDVLSKAVGGSAMTVAEATNIADNALEHTVRTILASLQAPEILKSTSGITHHHAE